MLSLFWRNIYKGEERQLGESAEERAGKQGLGWHDEVGWREKAPQK